MRTVPTLALAGVTAMFVVLYVIGQHHPAEAFNVYGAALLVVLALRDRR